jgi:hypothetical protein
LHIQYSFGHENQFLVNSSDHEVMGSSSGNSLLQKCRERLCT